MIGSACERGATEDKILDTAIKLFCRDGIHATGVDRIIEESGVARMTLYNKFGSKSGLIRSALEREGEVWRNWFLSEMDKIGAAPREKLLCVFDVLEMWFTQDDFYGCAFINAVAEHNKHDPQIRDLTLDHKKKILSEISSIAARAGAKDPEGVAHSLGMLMDGAIVTALVSGRPEAARDARNMAAVLLDALLPGKGKASAA